MHIYHLSHHRGSVSVARRCLTWTSIGSQALFLFSRACLWRIQLALRSVSSLSIAGTWCPAISRSISVATSRKRHPLRWSDLRGLCARWFSIIWALSPVSFIHPSTNFFVTLARHSCPLVSIAWVLDPVNFCLGCYLLERVVRDIHFGGLDLRGIRVRWSLLLLGPGVRRFPVIIAASRKIGTQTSLR